MLRVMVRNRQGNWRFEKKKKKLQYEYIVKMRRVYQRSTELSGSVGGLIKANVHGFLVEVICSVM